MLFFPQATFERTRASEGCTLKCILTYLQNWTSPFFGYGNGHAHRNKSKRNEDHRNVEFDRGNHLAGIKGCAVVKALWWKLLWWQTLYTYVLLTSELHVLIMVLYLVTFCLSQAHIIPTHTVFEVLVYYCKGYSMLNIHHQYGHMYTYLMLPMVRSHGRIEG